MDLFQTKLNDTLVAMGWNETKFNDTLGAMRWEHLWVLPLLVLLVAVMKVAPQIKSKNLYPKYSDIPSSILRRIATKRELQELSGNVDYVIVGSGIGGLTCAAILCRLGYKVVVFEQHYTVGGSTHTYKTEDFEFDVGVHYVGGKLDSWFSEMRFLFNFLSDGKLEWTRISENFDVAYNATTGERLEITGSQKMNRRVFLNHFPKLSAKALDAYYRKCFWVRNVSVLSFLLKLFPPFVTKMVWPLFGPLYRRICMRTTLEVMRECGIPNDAIGALLYNWGDLGTPPGDSPILMQAALAQHYVGGAYFPKGGSSSIAKTLVASIIARGGQVFATSPVEAILTKKARFSQGFRATGVRVRGIDILVRKSVISDAGYTKTFGLVPNSSPLVNEQAGASQKKLNDFNMRPSPAFFMLCVGLDGTDTELNLPAQNVWHVKDWDHDAYMHDMASMEVAEFLKVDPPLIFISNGSAKDPDYVRRHPGTATITLVAWTNRKWFDIYANSDHQHRNEEYENLKRVVTDKMLQVLYRHFPKTQGRVKVAEMGSPLTAIKYLGRATGEIYNLDHGVERFKSLGAQLALHPQTTVKNLYLAGQDQLAVSVEGAMLSGVFACARANLFAFTLVCAPALFVFLSLSLIFRGCAIGQEQ